MERRTIKRPSPFGSGLEAHRSDIFSVDVRLLAIVLRTLTAAYSIVPNVEARPADIVQSTAPEAFL